MTQKIKLLSIIVPLYNEEKRVLNLKKLYSYLIKKNFDWEIILINDGSMDNTISVVKKNIKEKRLKNLTLISYPQNKGKGFAIKTGMLKAKGDYRLFTDIDLSTPIEEFNKFLPFIGKYDVIIGSRKIVGSKVLVHQSLLREKLGKGFTKLSQFVLQIAVKDFTCGFKCFSKKAAIHVFSKQTTNKWGVDSEILFLAFKFGYRVKEIPVKWTNDPHSRVRFPQDIISSLFDLFRIRYNNLKKAYD